MTSDEVATDVLVIGSGFAGICLGVHLKQAGIDSFVMLEKAASLGGTWRENTYPGAACDIPAFAYCFSFEQKTDWSRKWAPQREILSYMHHCADKYGVTPHVRFGEEVMAARYDEHERRWHVKTAAGACYTARFLVSAVGQLNRPFVPEIAGLGSFEGALFHSAEWDHRETFEGKRVAVVGTAASAVQIIPELAEEAAELVVFQRSPNWIVPKNDRSYSAREQEMFARVPGLARAYRTLIWFAFEMRFGLFTENPLAVRLGTKYASDHLESQVTDPSLRRRLTPGYPVGAKRILTSDDYYPTLCRSDVRLVTEGIREVTPRGIVTASGEKIPLDGIVLATGFESTAFLAPMQIAGAGDLPLGEAWRRGAEAYLGMTVSGFPNFFMMYGPNTNLGHNSILFMLECQSRYIVSAMEAAKQRDLAAIDVKADVLRAYNDELATALAATVWARVERSWYKDENGRITNNWSGTTAAYWWRTRRFDIDCYHQYP